MFFVGFAKNKIEKLFANLVSEACNFVPHHQLVPHI